MSCYGCASTSRYYQSVSTDEIVHLCGIVPGDYESIERSSCKRERGHSRRIERERYRRSLDPCRYWSKEIPLNVGRFERRVRADARNAKRRRRIDLSR